MSIEPSQESLNQGSDLGKKHSISISEIALADWQRFKELRLRSITIDPDAFGGDFEATKNLTAEQWQQKLTEVTVIAGSAKLPGQSSELDVAVMLVENLIGDFGTTCWIGGCWVDPDFRGQGVLRNMIQYLDQNASIRNWQKQGLGVWEDNHSAIAAYAALGFTNIGEPKPSTSKPGKFYQRMIRESS